MSRLHAGVGPSPRAVSIAHHVLGQAGGEEEDHHKELGVGKHSEAIVSTAATTAAAASAATAATTAAAASATTAATTAASAFTWLWAAA